MRGPPVVLTNTLGRPVTNIISERGAVPMTVVNTLGEPVTLVNSGGEPVTLFNPNGTLWDYPFSLFSNNEQGAWYDPSDFSTLYQNSTGTTPVTAVEQPVGLMLDRSRGLVLGAELVTNGDFSDGTTAWIVLGAGTQLNSAFVVSGALQVSTTTEQNCATAVAVAAGKSIQIRFRARRVGATGVQCLVRASGNFGASSVDVHSFGNIGTDWADYVCVFTNLAAATTRLTFRDGSGGGGLYEIDDVSAKDLPGNHALQATSASRPVLRARYNLLTYSEQFDNGAWIKSNTGVASVPTVTANAGTAPDGTATADRVQYSLNGGTASGDISNLYQTNATTGALTHSVYLKSFDGVSSYNMQIIDSTGAGQPITVTGAWQRFSVSATSAGSINYAVRLRGAQSPTNSNTADVLIWGAQLLTAADQTSTGGAYQRIAAATDYDVSNPVWRPYLAFDGTDDGMATSSIDFSATDEVTVFAGVHKASDTARGAIVELTASAAANNGAFLLAAPNAASATFAFESKGTALTDAVETSIAAPTTAVLTGIGDISGDVTTLRRNGTQRDSDTGDQGSGNYANAALFIGRRNNASLPLNGRLYSLAVLGRTATAAEISAMEAWVNGKTGAY